METNVGELRRQSALQDSHTPVVIVVNDSELKGLKLEVVSFFPDTMDADNFFNHTFKIVVRKRKNGKGKCGRQKA